MSNSLWPHGCSPPVSSVHGILQIRILEWVAIPFSRESSQPRDWTPTEGRRRGDDRRWDVWTASPTQWTWDWANSGSWWWTGKAGVLQSTGLQRVGRDQATEMKSFIAGRFFTVWVTREAVFTYNLGIKVLGNGPNSMLIYFHSQG